MSNLDAYADDPIRQLIEDAHQLQELTRHPGWQVLTRLSGKDIEAWQTRMNSGKFKSLEEYKFCAGWLDGARQLLDVPATVQRQLERTQEAAAEEAKALAELEEQVRAEYPDFIDIGADT